MQQHIRHKSIKSKLKVTLEEAISIMGVRNVILPNNGLRLTRDPAECQKSIVKGRNGLHISQVQLEQVKDTHFLVFILRESIAFLSDSLKIDGISPVKGLGLLPPSCPMKKDSGDYYLLVPRSFRGIGDCTDVPCIENKLPQDERIMRLREGLYCLVIRQRVHFKSPDPDTWIYFENGWMASLSLSGELRLSRWDLSLDPDKIKIASALM